MPSPRPDLWRSVARGKGSQGRSRRTTLRGRQGSGWRKVQQARRRSCKTSFYTVTKTITKIGNSQGLMLDAALMDLARLKVGDQVSVTIHDGGAIVLTPLRPVIAPDQAATTARRLIQRNAELFRRLS